MGTNPGTTTTTSGLIRRARLPAVLPIHPGGRRRAEWQGWILMATKQSLTAGKAFAELVQRDPSFAAEGRAKLAAFAEAWRSEEMQGALAEFGRELKRIERTWEQEFGEPYPKSIEDFQEWIMRMDGGSLPYALAGDWTPAELFRPIQGYLKKLRDQKAAHRQTPDTKTDNGKNLPPSDVNDCARYIREQRKLINARRRPKATKKALIAEHLGHGGTAAMERALQPSRFGSLLTIGGQTDK